MDWSIVISVLALLFSIFTYLISDRKIKKQEHLLNEYNIKKIEQEDVENRKAYVCANMISLGRGRYSMKIYNSGKSEANNVKVEFLKELEGFYTDSNAYLYKQILPHDGVEFILYATMNCESTIGLKIEWNDSYKTTNVFEQYVNVPQC